MTSSTARAATAVALASLALLAGCGGGGGGAGMDTPSVSQKSFPLQKAMANLAATGYQKTVTATGTATYQGMQYPFTGTMQISESMVNANATFNGQPAIQESISTSGNVTIAGQLTNFSNTTQDYLTPNYAILGASAPGAYCVAQTPVQYPTSVTVGQSGTVAAISCYTDSTMTTALGTETINYSIGGGTSSGTATATIGTVIANAANQPLVTAQATYQIDTTGNFSVASTSLNLTINGVSIVMTLQ